MYEDESSDWSPVDLQTAVAAPPRRDHIEVASPRSSMDEESTAIDWQAMDREAASVAAKRAAIERAAAERSAATKFAAAAPLNAQAVRSSELMSGKHLDAAIQFASHRALAAANAELESALRTIAAGADASNTIPIRVNQLSAAMRALVEAEDFLPGSAAIQSGQSARGIAERHRTSVVRMQNREVSATDAVQVYFAFAQQSLLESVGHSRLSSEILYQLGKVCTESRGTSVVVTRAPSARATLFHETALRIDPSNYRSANELAVLLAKAGQWQQAKNYLMHSLSARQLPEAWFNLAKVHDQLGETGLAQRARHEYQLMAGQSAAPNQAAIQWVPPQQFDSAAAPSRPPTNRQRNGFPAQAMTPAPRQQQPNYTGQNSGQTNGDPPAFSWR